MEAQIGRGLRHQGIEHGIAGEAENVVRIVVFCPFHRLDPAVVAVAAPHDAGFRPMAAQALGHMLDDGTHLGALGGARRAQDRRDRSAARNVIDVHRRKTALVVMRVPERKLLAAMRRAERVVNVEDLQLVRLHARAELIKQSRRQPRRLGLARRILQTRDGRLRRQRCPCFRTAADRDLHQRIMPQPVEVDGVLVAARDRRRARHHHLEHRVPDAVRIAAIRHRFRKPPAHPELALRLSQQQQTAIRRLIAAVKINCEFLAPDRWKVEGKQRIVGHGGCGAGLIRDATCLDNDLLRESLVSCHSRLAISHRHA